MAKTRTVDRKRWLEVVLCLMMVAVVAGLLHRGHQQQLAEEQAQQAAQARMQAQFDQAIETGKKVALSAPRTFVEYSAYGMSGEDHRRFYELRKEREELDREYFLLCDLPETPEGEARLDEILSRQQEITDEMLELLR